MHAMAILIDSDINSQLQGETLHLAFLAFAGGAALISGAVNWLLRRDLKRRDDDQKAVASGLVELGEKHDKLKDKHGSEISDTRLAVAVLYQNAGLQQPNYPSR
jgi:hypothetical protein